ncbi:hypothetical protein GCM10008955_34870 [Deinococcus malanensis]|uniref:Winged helix-turn helix domain-containing protein n=1 Tax=Deinococcus malanensis TaxID=1706855 RepID=A0ABQ2F1A7_9DEIO|nr:winged helix-turn-helix domain-containing protein [Deinococcus malanensis]GGK38000.1 hypothetical protein GCM10008955_34870 [Deinococcus malanensis]
MTIRAWRARIRQRGEEALRASRSTGRPHHLSVDQQAVIQAIIEDDPRQHGFETSAWTTLRIRQVIGQKFDVWLDRGHLSRKLRGWGFSYQRPVVRAVERNEEHVATWVRVQGEALGKKNR